MCMSNRVERGEGVGGDAREREKTGERAKHMQLMKFHPPNSS